MDLIKMQITLKHRCVGRVYKNHECSKLSVTTRLKTLNFTGKSKFNFTISLDLKYFN